jgi:hypothetical protein
MNYRIFLELGTDTGLSLEDLYPIVDGLEKKFKKSDYGKTISRIGIVMSCLDRELKQR